MTVTPASTWNLPPPSGFEGLRDHLPLNVYEAELPHWRQEGATYFVTFRLGDSLPQAKLRELRQYRTMWLQRHPPPRSEKILDALAVEVFRRIENWLDQGMGRCLLRRPDFSQKLTDLMHRDDGKHYELGCYVVMPNHVHAVVRPLCPAATPLEEVLRLWKGSSSRAMNQALDSVGPVWQRESYDRIIRDAEHLYRVLQYIGNNPVKAKLPVGAYRLWIRPDWVKQGWNFTHPSSHFNPAAPS